MAAETDPRPDNQVTSQADTLEEEANQLPDAIHRLDPAKLAQQVEELLKEKTLLTPVERKIASQIRAILHPLSRRLSEAPAGATPSFKDLSTDLVRVNEQGEVQVYVILQDFTEDAVAQLERMGLRVELTLAEHRLIQGWVVSDAIEAIAELGIVERITPPDYLRHNSGAVNSQGDAVLRADSARSTFGVNGSGVKVCVLSNGVDHLAASVASGDLPNSPPVQVLRNAGGDEGTAMLEIVHDLAPGAQLAFYGVLTGAEFLQGLDAVTAAGCQVVVDDQFANLAPKFEDGLLAQKVRQLVTNGVVYVTAAGNFAQDHYFASYRRLLSSVLPPYMAFHNFSPTAVDIGDRFQVPPNGKVTVVLQWSNKIGASGDNFDLFLLRDDGTFFPCPTGPSGLCASINPQDGQGTPIEALVFTNTTGSAVFANVVIAELQLVSDPAKIKLNYFVFPDNFPSPQRQFVVPEDSVIGHAAVNGVLSVAAVNVANPTVIESFSSRGPATILFPTPETRSLPNITAVNRVQTRVGQLGFFANPFGGTSAAAPHVAAIAALLWSFKPTLTSSQVVQALTQNAVDLGSPGFDFTFGFGRIDALQAFSGSTPGSSAALPQILNVRTLQGIGGSDQQTFLTTDFVTFEATYVDPNPTCTGMAPVLLQLLLFNLEGQLLFTFAAGSQSLSEGSKSRLLFSDLLPGALPAGTYQHVFLVLDCTGVNIFVSGFQAIRVRSP